MRASHLPPVRCLALLAAGLAALQPYLLRADARDDRWRQDLATLSSELVRTHPNPYFTVSKADFDQAVSDLGAAIPTLPDPAVVVGFMRIAALIGDGHTQIDLFGASSTAGMRFLPLQLYWFEEGLYVIRTDAFHAAARGARVLKVGDTDVAKVESLVTAAISHENAYWVHERSPYYMISLDVLQALHVLPPGTGGTYLLERADGKRFTLELDAVFTSTWLRFFPTAPAPPPAPLYFRHPELNYWFEYLPADHLLYFQYNVCADQADRPFAGFAADLLSTLDANPGGRLILDLRNNSGGNSGILSPLYNGLVSRGLLAQPGRAAVVIGRRTFSSGLINALQLHTAGAALVGEPTGGKPNSYGEVQTFQLPNSRLTRAPTRQASPSERGRSQRLRPASRSASTTRGSRPATAWIRRPGSMASSRTNPSARTWPSSIGATRATPSPSRWRTSAPTAPVSSRATRSSSSRESGISSANPSPRAAPRRATRRWKGRRGARASPRTAS